MEGEDGCRNLEDPDVTEGVNEAKLSVLIHVLGGKPLNLEGFKMAMGKSWKCGFYLSSGWMIYITKCFLVHKRQWIWF